MDLTHDQKAYWRPAKEALRPFSDFSWYCIDRKSCVAVFGSAGVGYIPSGVFSSEEEFFFAKDFFENLIGTSDYQVVDRRETLDQSQPLVQDWLQHAQGGVYVYDHSTLHLVPTCPDKIPYRQILRPTNPISVTRLPTRVRDYLSGIVFREIDFDSSREVWLRQHFDSVV